MDTKALNGGGGGSSVRRINGMAMAQRLDERLRSGSESNGEWLGLFLQVINKENDQKIEETSSV